MLIAKTINKDELCACAKQMMNTNVKVCVNKSNQCWRGHSGLFWVLGVLTAGVQGPRRIINLNELYQHLFILMCLVMTLTQAPFHLMKCENIIRDSKYTGHLMAFYRWF